MNLLIAGGGASGLTAAITAKRTMPELRVTVLEANDRAGKKLLLTGNGRCNITNADLSPAHYHGGNPGKMCGNGEIVNFFESIGTEIVFEPDGRAFPASYQASSVLDNLRTECGNLGAEIITGQKVTSLDFSSGKFEAVAESRFYADAVILCCGSPAGGKAASDSGYALLRGFGHRINPVTPAIVPVKTENTITKKLKGIKVKALVTLLKNGEKLGCDSGEVLFCDYGLSGPPILQLSGMAAGGKNLSVSLDLFPDTNLKTLTGKIQNRIRLLHSRTVENFFTGLINKKLGQTICALCGCGLRTPVTELPANRLAAICKALTFRVTGVMPMSEAQAAAGGADLSQFGEGFMSKLRPGLFACGELLDIVGDCGGYNLAFAWSSGMAAARAAVRFIKSKAETRNFPFSGGA